MNRILTRRDFLKVAGGGAAEAALLGSSLAAGAGYSSYLPKGGSRMNVVLIILDSLRRDHVGVYGSDWIKTPNLDALANESLRFTRPYPDSIPTICSRRSMHTGIKTWPFRDFTPVKGGEASLTARHQLIRACKVYNPGTQTSRGAMKLALGTAPSVGADGFYTGVPA